MIRVITSILFVFLLNNLSFSQAIEWDQSFGGSGPDFAYAIQETTDLGYIMAGSAGDLRFENGDSLLSKGGNDFWVVKFSQSGDIVWKKNYGGSGADVASAIAQTNDQGFIITGSSYSNDLDLNSNNGSNDIWVIKLAANGELEWEQSFGGSALDEAYSVQQTMDQGYIIGGSSESADGDVGGNKGERDAWVLKLAANGDLEWEQNYGGSDFEYASNIQQTIDQGYIMVGATNSADGDVGENNGAQDIWLVKLDINGGIEWEQNYGGSGTDFTNAVQQTMDQGYIIGGSSDYADGDVGGNNGVFDFWVLKLNASGELEWEQNFGAAYSDMVSAIQQTSDQGYIVAGTIESDGEDGYYGDFDFWVIKLNESGELEWSQNYGGTDWDRLYAMDVASDQGYILAGASRSRDTDLDNNNGGKDIWVLKISPMATNTEEIGTPSNFSILPNPSNGQFSISINNSNTAIPMTMQITDLLGHTIIAETTNASEYEFRDIPKGAYHITISNQYFTESKMFIVH